MRLTEAATCELSFMDHRSLVGEDDTASRENYQEQDDVDCRRISEIVEQTSV